MPARDAKPDLISASIAPATRWNSAPLTSVRDLFGSGPDLKVIPDTDFDPIFANEDILRIMKGERLDRTIYYHQSTPEWTGWYVNEVKAGVKFRKT